MGMAQRIARNRKSPLIKASDGGKFIKHVSDENILPLRGKKKKIKLETRENLFYRFLFFDRNYIKS